MDVGCWHLYPPTPTLTCDSWVIGYCFMSTTCYIQVNTTTIQGGSFFDRPGPALRQELATTAWLLAGPQSKDVRDSHLADLGRPIRSVRRRNRHRNAWCTCSESGAPKHVFFSMFFVRVVHKIPCTRTLREASTNSLLSKVTTRDLLNFRSEIS